jgi:CHASE2 domain
VTSIRPLAKFVELLVLGLIIGLLSIGLSFLWQEYKYKTSDLIQSLSAKFFPSPLKFPLVIIDIGEDTCKEWAKNKYGGECAFLPRFPHDRLKEIFVKLADSFERLRSTDKLPKLVVVDIDLRSEEPEKYNGFEKQIRQVVEDKTQGVPLLIAQPLIRIPKEDQKQQYDYVAVGTILHNLAKPKEDLRFAQVEQDLGDDSVLRSFPATIQLLRPDTLDPDPGGRNRKEHLALEVCELVHDANFCGRDSDSDPTWHQVCKPVAPENLCKWLRFGAHQICPDDLVQFRYRLAPDVDRLVDLDVKVIEARAVLAKSFDASVLNNAVVIVGSTARGRGDYHFTPLDVDSRGFRSGETAGVIVLANEIVAALENRWLREASWGWELLEKLLLVVISTITIFLIFWRPRLHRNPLVSRSPVSRFFSGILLAMHFVVAAAVVVVVNATIGWLIFLKLFDLGEVADPVTPVVAAVLDAVVDVCTVIGHHVGSRFDRPLSQVGHLLRGLRLRAPFSLFVIMYVGGLSTSSARAESGGTIASIKDVDPLTIEIKITGFNGVPKSGGPGTSIVIGDTLSIHEWCTGHPHRAGHVVIAGSGGVQLNCGGKEEYTFTDHGTILPQIQLSAPTKPTTSTITSERPGAAPTIAVSPTRVPDKSTTAPSPIQSPKIEDLLRKGDVPPLAK